MKNYIANEYGGWATSSGYVKHTLARSIHYGRLYTSGTGHAKGRKEDLYEALRCLGQGLHCLEDFAAHTNYVELSLREMGYHAVFPHTGTATQINLHGKFVFPLVTGTFGAVDFLHSGQYKSTAGRFGGNDAKHKLVLGEATDHFTQSEIDEMYNTLGSASEAQRSHGGSSSSASGLVSLLSKVPGTSGLCQEAQQLQAASDAQAAANRANYGGSRGFHEDAYSTRDTTTIANQPPQQPMPGGMTPQSGIPGMSIDPQATIAKIYPILEFRDKVVRAISSAVSKVPGLESLLEKISETVTAFVLSLLAPFIQPIIRAVSAQLKQGSSAVVDASGRHQYEPWTDPYCTDPTHSLLSKDHFSNPLNEPAGHVAAAVLRYVAPRVVYAWEQPSVPLQQVLDDVVTVFHHPAVRNRHSELHNDMFRAVERWVHERPDRGAGIDHLLSSESVRAGKNHQTGHGHGHGHGHPHPSGSSGSSSSNAPFGSLSNVTNKLPSGLAGGLNELQNVAGGLTSKLGLGGLSHGFLGGAKRDMEDDGRY